MAEIIPLQAVPNQTLTTQLSNVVCTVTLWQKSTGLFLDLYVAGAPLALGMLCLNATTLLRDYAALGFDGDLAFIDTLGTQDPDYTGLASRYVLVHYTAADLAAAPQVY